MVSYRLIRAQSLVRPRSTCPHCKHILAWYDLIPLISWCMLHGSCRYCKHPISLLYPFIELVTAASITALYYAVPHHYFAAYFIFFSALIVTIRSDLETMLICRFVTLFLIPVGLLCSAIGWLPLSLPESISGTVFGYAALWITSRFFLWLTGKEGMGQGDLELLAFIGSFIGIFGCWFSLMIGSITGSVIGLAYLHATHAGRSAKIPFGPFLACGAMGFVLLQPYISSLLASYLQYAAS